MNKRTPNGYGTIRQRVDKSFEGRIVIDGKRVSVYGRTIADVKAKMSELKKPATPVIPASNHTMSDEYTVSQWLSKWQSEWLIQVKETTRRRYDMEVRLHIVPDLGDVKLSELTTLQVQRLYNELSNSGLSPKSIKCTHGVLHEALEKAVEQGLMAENVTDKCSVPQQVHYEMRPFRAEEVSEFLDKIRGHRYEDAYYVSLFTGIREAELMGLTWDCVDFESGTIRIYRQLQRTLKNGEYSFQTPKNQRSRTIKPASEVMDRLRKLKQQSDDSPFVFVCGTGEHLTINMLYKPFKKIVKDMGIENMRFHDLRHTYALLSLQSGCDIKTLSANLGHATVAFTLDRYGHVSKEMLDQNSERMQNLICQLTKPTVKENVNEIPLNNEPKGVT